MTTKIKMYSPFAFNPARPDKVQQFIQDRGLTFLSWERGDPWSITLTVSEDLTAQEKTAIRSTLVTNTKQVIFDDEGDFND